MKPYYDDGTCTIYHGDCREVLQGDCRQVLPLLAVNLVIADPPYGGRTSRRSTSERIGASRPWHKVHGLLPGDNAPFDPSPLLGLPRLVLFGANYFADKLPPSGGWIVWDKRRGGTVTPGWNGSDAELAWTNLGNSVRVFSHLWAGYKRDSEIGEHYHPTQKPVALMAWIIKQWTQPGDLVLDPYMGSGPVLRAAKETGRRAIGIEIEERYCEIAAKRLGQEVLALGGEA